MGKRDIHEIVLKQREYFLQGKTLPLEVRMEALSGLKTAIIRHETEIGVAIKKDLGKSAFESYMCETGMILSEITHMLKHMKRYAKDRIVLTPLAQFPSVSYKKKSPYGVVLIMSPWNYPFLLTFGPMIDALAAGNTCVVKPSAYSPNASALIERIVNECFLPEYVTVVTGGRAENTSLLEEHFDYIFFTGSQAVGKEVMRKAAEHLTPVTLELGGKSPCIVDETANIRLAAKRIVFGKYLNCGQTCVAPDYIYCAREVKDELIQEMKKQIRRQFGKSPMERANYGKMINEKHFDRVLGLMDAMKIVHGGQSDREKLKIEPTIIDHVTFDDPVMCEEIFGPVLPVLTYDSIDEAIDTINARPHPLALYYFSSDRDRVTKVMSRCSFGGGCVNDTIIHLATTEMGFGGFGESGMGAYHGKTGFDTFSHSKSIVDKKTWLDLPMRYQPYRKINDKLIHFFLK